MKNRLYRAYQRAFLHIYGWATLRLYDELAWAYDPISQFVSAGRWGAWRTMALDEVAGPRVLELGFGTGELLIEMSRRGLSVTGLELSRPMHRVTSRKLAQRQVGVARVRARAERLPFAADSFDTVLSTFPAGYILDPATLLEIRRVLTPAGRLVIGGLIVQLPRSPRYPLSIIPAGSWDRLWAYLQARTAEAGMGCSVAWRDDFRARVPVVICAAPEGEQARRGAPGTQ